MDTKFNAKKRKFGWKEIILCAVLAFVLIIFVVVFTGNTATVKFVSVGGEFDAGEGASIYDYDYYTKDSTEATTQKYHEVLTKKFRISSVATLPETEREGYVFDGWFFGSTDENGNVIYGEEFSAKAVKNLAKDSETTVYAKWSIEDEGKTITRKASILAALDITWKGMLGIFTVITIIFLCIVGLNLLTRKMADRKQAKLKAEAEQAASEQQASEQAASEKTAPDQEEKK